MQVVAVSHKWVRKNHPDPDGSKLAALKQKLEPYRGTNTGVFVDFFCLKQHNTFEADDGTIIEVKRSEAEEKEVSTVCDRSVVCGVECVCVQFRQQLNDMNLVYFMADDFVLLPSLYHDYLSSSWCVFEAILADLSGSITCTALRPVYWVCCAGCAVLTCMMAM